MKNVGEQFLHQKDPGLQSSAPVEYEVQRKKIANLETSQKPADKIADWLKIIERTHIGHRENPKAFEKIKKYYHQRHVIKPKDVPEAAFLLEQRIARERGCGTIEITDDFREKKTEEIINNQKASLDKWLNYLSSKEADYPMWAKYWAFTSMLQMGRFEKVEKGKKDEEKKEFGRFAPRIKDTVAAFPTLNARALANTISAMSAKLEREQLAKKDRKPIENLSVKLDSADFRELLSTEDFSRLYSQFLIELPEYSTEGLKETRGEWVRYEQFSDPKPLVDSLEGFPLEWCTANIDTARTQLQGGDFFVYYSINDEGKPIIPRVAIKMENNKIAEVRGIAPDQHLDPYIGEEVGKKMTEFPDSKEYEKKAADMKRLTKVEEKNKVGESLTASDLKFLYEIESEIEGFGHDKDPRIKEILATRKDIREDICLATGYTTEQISLTKEEALAGGIKFHYGDLEFDSLPNVKNLILPETVSGNLSLSCHSTKYLTLPKIIGGDLSLDNLESTENLVLPETIGGSLLLNELESTDGLVLPKKVGGYLGLDGLQSAKGLVLPETIGGSLCLNSLKSAEGLVLPEIIGGSLELKNLKSAEGLELPKTVGDFLDLSGLKSADGLEFPETVGGFLDLTGLLSAERLRLPENVGGNLSLDNVQSVEWVKMPETVGGNLCLKKLQSGKGLKLPQTIGGNLNLTCIQSAKGLELPEIIYGDLYLHSLKSVEGLRFPKTVGGTVTLDGLSQKEKENLRLKYPNLDIGLKR